MAGQQFNLAIIGAGIGGLALAIGLTRHNIPFTIYESALAFSIVGAGVGLGPNALRAMDLLDQRFRDLYTGIATGNLRPEKRYVMMEAMLMEEGLGAGERWWGHGDWGAPYFERTGAHRKDLLDLMTSLIYEGAVCFNKTVANIHQTNDRVTLTFADGEIAHHVAVIGCDGIKGQAAFRAYDETRRPRAQRQVVTARECGEVYNSRIPRVSGEVGVEGVERRVGELLLALGVVEGG